MVIISNTLLIVNSKHKENRVYMRLVYSVTLRYLALIKDVVYRV